MNLNDLEPQLKLLALSQIGQWLEMSLCTTIWPTIFQLETIIWEEELIKSTKWRSHKSDPNKHTS